MEQPCQWEKVTLFCNFMLASNIACTVYSSNGHVLLPTKPHFSIYPLIETKCDEPRDGCALGWARAAYQVWGIQSHQSLKLLLTDYSTHVYSLIHSCLFSCSSRGWYSEIHSRNTSAGCLLSTHIVFLRSPLFWEWWSVQDIDTWMGISDNYDLKLPSVPQFQLCAKYCAELRILVCFVYYLLWYSISLWIHV